MAKNKNWQVPKYSLTEYRSKLTNYCVCIPLINEGEKFKKQLKQMGEVSKQADIIILDGGSTDGSTEGAFLKENNVRALLVKTDQGKLSAQLRMGYAYALEQGYEGIITIDGNGKDGVGAISSFIRKLDEGYDYIQGSRFIKGGRAINTPKFRYFSIRLIHAPLLSLGAFFWLTDTTNGFRAYSRRYLQDKRVQPFRKVFVKYELLAYLSIRASRLGYKVTEIPVERRYPNSGKIPTKINFWGNFDLVWTVLKTLIGYYNPSRV